MIIAGTGHRPNKLGGYNEKASLNLINLASDYLNKNKQIKRIITGGAQGWDMALAQASWQAGIPYTMAVPFIGQEKFWPQDGIYSQTTYRILLDRADKIHVVSKGSYSADKMQKRNEWMVDKCDLVLAVWDGSTGGTYNCIKYANLNNKKIINLWELYGKKSGVVSRGLE